MRIAENRGIAVDVSVLIDQEEIFCENCIITKNSKAKFYEIINGKIKIHENVFVDETNLTYIFQNFSAEVGEATYFGGEMASHGSGGFFGKKIGGSVSWILISLESNPFIGVEVRSDSVAFLSSNGFLWKVPSDDLTMVYIEPTNSELYPQI